MAVDIRANFPISMIGKCSNPLMRASASTKYTIVSISVTRTQKGPCGISHHTGRSAYCTSSYTYSKKKSVRAGVTALSKVAIATRPPADVPLLSQYS